MSRVALCKDADARREAQRVATTTRKPRNAADAPCRRNPVGPGKFALGRRRFRLAQAQIYLGRGHVESSDRLLESSLRAAAATRTMRGFLKGLSY